MDDVTRFVKQMEREWGPFYLPVSSEVKRYFGLEPPRPVGLVICPVHGSQNPTTAGKCPKCGR